MGKKDLPAVDFHAVIARRDPALADRMVREGLAATASHGDAPLLAVVPPPPVAPEARLSDDILAAAPPPPSEVENARPKAAQVSQRVRKSSPRKRGVVQRADGREAGRITVYVPTAVALRLRQHCFEHDQTISDVAGEVLVEALERRFRKPA
jgi:hypothetical protein